MKGIVILLLFAIIGTENIYFSQTVTIGKQEWMTKNLDVSTFRNGDQIPEVKTQESWEAASKNKQPAWCYFNNNSSNGIKFGKLYNYWAVADPRGLAPAGWHVPTGEELIILQNYVGFQNGGSLKSKSSWNNYTVEITCPSCKNETNYCSKCEGRGKIDKTYNGNGMNSTSYNAFPAGYRLGWCCHYNGGFFSLNEQTTFWSSSNDGLYNNEYSVLKILNNSMISIGHESPGNGFSVRCIKDTKEYLEKKAVETLQNNEKTLNKTLLENFKNDFKKTLEEKNSQDCFKYIQDNKIYLMKIFDGKEEKGYIAALTHLALKAVMVDLIKSIDENYDDNFEFTNKYFDLIGSQDFKSFEKKIFSLGFTYDETKENSYANLKKKVKEIEDYITFKKKIRRVKLKELSNLEKSILGIWEFKTKDGKRYRINLNTGREIEISEINKKSGEYKSELIISNFGAWEFDGDSLIYYPQWDYVYGRYSDIKYIEKKLNSLKEKIEPKFLIGEAFSIENYKKALVILEELTNEYMKLYNEFEKNEVGYSFTEAENKTLTILKYRTYEYRNDNNSDLKSIKPLDGKSVRMDLPNIRKKVEEMRVNYSDIKIQLENSKKNLEYNIKYSIQLEGQNSLNLDKKNIKRYSLRFEGEKAMWNGIIGERVK